MKLGFEKIHPFKKDDESVLPFLVSFQEKIDFLNKTQGLDDYNLTSFYFDLIKKYLSDHSFIFRMLAFQKLFNNCDEEVFVTRWIAASDLNKLNQKLFNQRVAAFYSIEYLVLKLKGLQKSLAGCKGVSSNFSKEDPQVLVLPEEEPILENADPLEEAPRLVGDLEIRDPGEGKERLGVPEMPLLPVSQIDRPEEALISKPPLVSTGSPARHMIPEVFLTDAEFSGEGEDLEVVPEMPLLPAAQIDRLEEALISKSPLVSTGNPARSLIPEVLDADGVEREGSGEGQEGLGVTELPFEGPLGIAFCGAVIPELNPSERLEEDNQIFIQEPIRGIRVNSGNKFDGNLMDFRNESVSKEYGLEEYGLDEDNLNFSGIPNMVEIGMNPFAHGFFQKKEGLNRERRLLSAPKRQPKNPPSFKASSRFSFSKGSCSSINSASLESISKEYGVSIEEVERLTSRQQINFQNKIKNKNMILDNIVSDLEEMKVIVPKEFSADANESKNKKWIKNVISKANLSPKEKPSAKKLLEDFVALNNKASLRDDIRRPWKKYWKSDGYFGFPKPLIKDNIKKNLHADFEEENKNKIKKSDIKNKREPIEPSQKSNQIQGSLLQKKTAFKKKI